LALCSAKERKPNRAAVFSRNPAFGGVRRVESQVSYCSEGVGLKLLNRIHAPPSHAVRRKRIVKLFCDFDIWISCERVVLRVWTHVDARLFARMLPE
jgi:hypothetical protein